MMQFSIRVAIVFTALIALSFRAVLTFRQIQESKSGIAALRDTVDGNRLDTETARNKLRVLQNGFDAADDYSRVTHQANRAFVAIQEEHGSLRISRPDRVKVARYPMVSSDKTICHRWQIYIPETDDVFLRLSVVRYRQDVELKKSDFEPTGPIEISMPSGISSVTFQWQETAGKPTATVLINGDTVYSGVYNQTYRRASVRVRVPSDTSQRRKTRFDLLEFTPTAKERFTFRIHLDRFQDAK